MPGWDLDSERIVTNVAQWGYDPARIHWLFLIHAHADHAGGAAALAAMTGCRVIGAAADAALIAAGDEELLSLRAAKRNGTYPVDYRFRTHADVAAAVDGEIFVVGDVSVQAIHVPGHTPGSTCYWWKPTVSDRCSAGTQCSTAASSA